MKKLVFLFVAVAAVSFASCGGNANNTEAAPVEDTTACCGGDSCCADSACCAEVAVAE